jgi:hypothetical protein
VAGRATANDSVMVPTHHLPAAYCRRPARGKLDVAQGRSPRVQGKMPLGGFRGRRLVFGCEVRWTSKPSSSAPQWVAWSYTGLAGVGEAARQPRIGAKLPPLDGRRRARLLLPTRVRACRRKPPVLPYPQTYRVRKRTTSTAPRHRPPASVTGALRERDSRCPPVREVPRPRFLLRTPTLGARPPFGNLVPWEKSFPRDLSGNYRSRRAPARNPTPSCSIAPSRGLSRSQI